MGPTSSCTSGDPCSGCPDAAAAAKGEGEGGNEHVGSLLGTCCECLFLDGFSDVIFEASDAILKPLGTYFGSLRDAFE